MDRQLNNKLRRKQISKCDVMIEITIDISGVNQLRSLASLDWITIQLLLLRSLSKNDDDFGAMKKRKINH